MPRHPRLLAPVLFASLVGLSSLGASCSSDEGSTPVVPADPASKLASLKSTETWKFPALGSAVHVVRTEGNVPHIYAKTRKDLAFVQGFVMARDRFFMMDLARRLGLGKLSALLGDSTVARDLESRGSGTAYLADRIEENLGKDLTEHVDAFVAGINEYIVQVDAGKVPEPTEITIAGKLLGAKKPTDLMVKFTRRDIAGVVALVVYQSGYETGDVGRARSLMSVKDAFAGVVNEGLRKAGLIQDVMGDLRPVWMVSSAKGQGLDTGTSSPPPGTKSGTKSGTKTMSGPPVPSLDGPFSLGMPLSIADRMVPRLHSFQKRLLRDHDVGFGSNAWAVNGAHTKDGAGLLAGDGHLSLAIPSVLWQEGLDTATLGGGDLHQLGLVIPGMPIIPIGTNGKVAWSQTQVSEDITDWYKEEIQLGADGLPKASLFKGEFKPLVKVDEVYEVATVDLLKSKGGKETWSRWTTFDGRWIAEIEGRTWKEGEVLKPGEVKIQMRGAYVIPGDTDGDGKISAVSFDYAGLDGGTLLAAYDSLGKSGSAAEFRTRAQGVIAYSQNFVVADSGGHILYTSYQAIPCRGYLDRKPDGLWADGANPNYLLDGSKYGGFRIPVKNGIVDEEPGKTDKSACVVPLASIPQSYDPDKGYVLTANNDPGGMTFDNSLINDSYYLGGPWDIGARADSIDQGLKKVATDKSADIKAMADLQHDVKSRLGELFVPHLLEAIEVARGLEKSGATAPADKRLLATYVSEKAAVEEAYKRLTAWRDGGLQAKSGVETFYQSPNAKDREDAVATTIFNSFLGPYISKVFDDEKMPDVWPSGGGEGKVNLLKRMLDKRGDKGKEPLASFDPATKESVYFDVLGTPDVESSRELMLLALKEGFVFLRSAPKGDVGGYGTNDMAQWVWGLRHRVRLRSLLSDFLGEDTRFDFITDKMQIDTSQLPLFDGLAKSDPRSELIYFPRDADQWAVDAGNNGFSGRNFDYGSGPVMRMVVSLKGDTVTGQNIIPGGQSGLNDSPFFNDQAKLWLGNKTFPLRFSLDDVLAGAIGHEVYSP